MLVLYELMRIVAMVGQRSQMFCSATWQLMQLKAFVASTSNTASTLFFYLNFTVCVHIRTYMYFAESYIQTLSILVFKCTCTYMYIRTCIIVHTYLMYV